MGTVERRLDAAERRGRSLLTALCNEFRMARMEHGLSQAEVAHALGISQSRVSRIERGASRAVSVPELTRLLAAVGLVFSGRAFPDGAPIRDVAHRKLLDRLRALTPPSVQWRFEVPLPIAGDLRAWDATLLCGPTFVGVEAETAPRDIQALQRHVNLKLRDDPRVDQVVVLLADTRRNRRLTREHGESLRADWPLAADTVIRALEQGFSPGGSGFVLL